MKEKFANAFMQTARVFSELSYCQRRQVGCVIVREGERNQHNIVSIGYNGTAPGDINVCENDDGVTKTNVIHAEMNAITKLRNDGVDMGGTVLFCTTAPCPACAEEILAEKIATVFYSDVYRTDEGLQILQQGGVNVFQID